VKRPRYDAGAHLILATRGGPSVGGGGGEVYKQYGVGKSKPASRSARVFDAILHSFCQTKLLSP
jgi:hypothetical protein